MRNIKLVGSLSLVGLVVIFVVRTLEVLFIVLAIGVVAGRTPCSARRAG